MQMGLDSLDWENIALASEIEYSKALGSTPVEYPNFIHMHNPFVPWGGDFNRTLGVKLFDDRSFEAVVSQVESLHRDRGLEKPDRFDIHPPALEAGLWQDYLSYKGYRLETAIFFYAPVLSGELAPDFSLVIPTAEKYIDWLRRLVQARGYYDEAWFQKLRPLQLNFTNTFKPYWFLRNGEFVGWVYCAHLGECARLFEVEICQEQRGQGLGKLLLQAIRMASYQMGARFVLLQAGEGLRAFYENAGFQECSRNSIIWQKG